MAKKIKKSQILRHSVQLILFILLPGLYAMAFSELRTVYQMIIKGNFNLLVAFPSSVEVTAVMLLTIVMGRWFCGWLCAFGAYNDLVYFISRKVFKLKFRVDEKVDSILKYSKYLILIFIIITSWTMGSNILSSTSPWDAFGQISDLSTVLSSLIIGLILLVLITIGAAFIERFFCRYLCPLGAVFSIISKLGIIKINKPKADCGKCRACTINCSMGLQLYKVDGVRGGDCINCLKCTEVCPRNNGNVNMLGKDVNQNLASSVAMATMLGVYGLSNFSADALTKSGVISSQNEITSNAVVDSVASSNIQASTSNASQAETSSSSTSSSQGAYKDGTYTGSGIGFKGRTTKVSVTVANGKISNIETLSYGDDRKWYERASSSVISKIISKQSTSVDAVSGATYSSKGIMSAVANALSQASNGSSTGDDLNDDSETKDESTTSNSEKKSRKGRIKSSSSNISENETEDVTSGSEGNERSTSSNSTSTSVSNYKDGTYTGSGKGFKGRTTTVSVTVADGKITNVKTLSYGDDRPYYERASGSVISNIISKQSTSVDTVSGATYSSKGIMSAVANALSQAK